ncbi:G patch domain-containing protein 4 [Synchiropus splendidus]|uniref:G patch domain-containing protein 4 n=1 Tax=Synchiropus splendidus TaxID=270530 RepID=UPI00237E705F|nr:G patch domain-containing protein 4 [Synchiropus splendidus]
MAEVVQEKSRGLTFAEKQLKRHGWKEGKGLGREENGISEAIKVKVKCNKGGVGHKEGEQFTFHWWDHVFNKASSSLQVESDQNGIVLKKTEVSEDDGSPLSNKKPRKASLAKAKLYGCFVKSATLLSGQEQPEAKSSKSDDSSSSSSSDEDDDQRLDLSSTTKISDSALMKACGGRTAHKGARHGLTMSAKLARLEQQEAEFMAKYGKKTLSASEATTAGSSQSTDQEVVGKIEENSTVKTKKKKKSKKKSPELIPVVDEAIPEEGIKTSKKKKKSKSQGVTGETIQPVALQEEVVQTEEVEHIQVTKNKHKKKGTSTGEDMTSSEFTGQETTADSDSKMRKKKKKSSKHYNEEENCDSKTSSRECVDQDSDIEETEPSGTQKRKKCKKDKEGHEEELRPKKRKKKSKDA